MVTETPNTILLRLDSAKSGKKFWLLSKNSQKNIYKGEVLRLGSKSSFILIDRTDVSGTK